MRKIWTAALLAAAGLALCCSCRKDDGGMTPATPEKPDDPGVYEEGFYVTVSGAGLFSGEDWDNAMSVENLKDLLLADASGSFSAAKAARINGKIIHLEQGIYPLGSAANPKPVISGETAAFSVTIKGGYRSGIYTQYPDKYPTYLSGDSDYRIFEVKGEANLTLDGVGLTGARGTGGGQAAVILRKGNFTLRNATVNNIYNHAAAGAFQVTGSAVMTARNCLFTNNVAGGGGAINVDGTGTCRVWACRFVNNGSSTNGGAVKYSNGTFEADSCLFEANPAFEYGGAIWVNGNANPVRLSHCTFRKNSAGKRGGAIYLNGTNGRACCNDCLFEDNFANENSGCYYNVSTASGRLYFNACAFQRNSIGSTYGTENAMPDASAGAIVALNNCCIRSGFVNHDANSQQSCWWSFTKGKMVFSNCSIIGVPTANGKELPAYGLLRLNSNELTVGLVNNLIVSTNAKGFGIFGGDTQTNLNVTGKFNKMSPWNTQKANTFTYTPGTGDELTYYAGSLPGLTWNGRTWVWNGLSAAISRTNEINAALRAADADFYSWLEGIGAIGKDMAGRSRGEYSWPGAYQKN